MTTYKDQEMIIKYAREAWELAKEEYWINSKESMIKAIELIDGLQVGEYGKYNYKEYFLIL